MDGWAGDCLEGGRVGEWEMGRSRIGHCEEFGVGYPLFLPRWVCSARYSVWMGSSSESRNGISFSVRPFLCLACPCLSSICPKGRSAACRLAGGWRLVSLIVGMLRRISPLAGYHESVTASERRHLVHRAPTECLLIPRGATPPPSSSPPSSGPSRDPG